MTETQDLLRCRCAAVIDTGALVSNYRALHRALHPDERLLAVVKANAYGHGAVTVSRLLAAAGADFLGVATAEEALELVAAGLTLPVLVLGHVPSAALPELIRAGIRLTADSLAEASEIADIASSANSKPALLHLAVDTGMTRIGFLPSASSAAEIAQLASLPGIRLEGVFSHPAAADAANPLSYRAAAARFRAFCDLLAALGVKPPLRHFDNTAGILHGGSGFEMARAGILLYGLPPSRALTGNSLSPRPVMSFRARVVRVAEVPAGTPVSYGETYVTNAPTRIATLAAGYADGIPRALSGRGTVQLGGVRCPLLGRICMDQCMADVTAAPAVCVGDYATFFGGDGAAAEDVATLCGTIGYELVCGISARVPRLYM